MKYMSNKVNGKSAKIVFNGKEVSKIRDVTDSASPKILYEAIEPYTGTFADATWEQVKQNFEQGNPAKFKLGDTKNLTCTWSDDFTQTYTIRICDMLEGRYETDDGKKNHAVLEFVEVYRYFMTMNDSSTNVGGWAQSKMKTTNLPAVLDVCPDDFKSILLNVKLWSTTGGSSWNTDVTSSYSKVFLPSWVEIFNGTDTWFWASDSGYLRGYNAEDPENKGQFQLYKQKGISGATSAGFSFTTRYGKNGTAYAWWERSPKQNTVIWCNVGTDGRATDLSATTSKTAVIPFFAI